MISLKKIQSNRRNALKSTGPRTLAGKAKASRNAMKHGLLSRDLLLPDYDDAEAYNRLLEGLIEDLQPRGFLERLLVEKIACAILRRSRLIGFEKDVIDYNSRKHLRRTGLIDPEQTDLFSLGDAFVEDAFNGQAFGKLARYEAHVERGFYRALHELQRLQAARRGEAGSVPVAIDLDLAEQPPSAG